MHTYQWRPCNTAGTNKHVTYTSLGIQGIVGLHKVGNIGDMHAHRERAIFSSVDPRIHHTSCERGKCSMAYLSIDKASSRSFAVTGSI